MELNRDELALLAEACDVQVEAFTDTLMHGEPMEAMDEEGQAERRSIEQERDAYVALYAKIKAALE